MESLLAFIWAVVRYIIDLASWLVYIFISIIEVLCAILAVALIAHMINVLTN
jgi:hypothetical protein